MKRRIAAKTGRTAAQQREAYVAKAGELARGVPGGAEEPGRDAASACAEALNKLAQ